MTDRELEYRIQIPIEDWQLYTTSTDYVSTRHAKQMKPRKSLRASFTRILIEKIQSIGDFIFMLKIK